MVTILDVARKAGVSIASVSYALNGKPLVSEDTRAHIRKIADDLGYLPNAMAAGLVKKVTNLIGLIVPEITEVYTGRFIKHLEEEARNAGFYPILASTGGEPEMEEALIRSLMGRNIDACVILPGNRFLVPAYRRVLSLAEKRGIPFVFANISIPGIRASSVALDLEGGQYRLTRFLVGKGAADILFVGGRRGDFYADLRLSGFRAALADGSGLHLPGGISFESGYLLARDFLAAGNKLPEAICAMNDSVALGVLKALKERGVAVPGDILLAGFDNIALPTIDAPRLTTMEIPVARMCAACVDIIHSLSEEPNSKHEIRLDTNFVQGDTA